MKNACDIGCGFTPTEIETVLGTNDVDYRGTQTKTIYGLTCQAWDVDIPNNRGLITPANYPDADLT